MNRRLATPGAVLFVVGVVLMWWGAGVFRGDGNSPSKIIGSIPKTDRIEPTKSGGAGSARTM